jgi:hypothetical protein
MGSIKYGAGSSATFVQPSRGEKESRAVYRSPWGFHSRTAFIAESLRVAYNVESAQLM